MHDAPTLKREGNRLLAERKYDEAEDTFRALIRIAPSAPDGYVGLARVFDVDDRINDIIALIDPVVDHISSARLLKTAAIAYRMAVLRGWKAGVPRAIALHERYLTERGDAVVSFYLGELLLEQGEEVRAMDAYRKAWELQPDYVDAHRAYSALAQRLEHKS
jgi:tetratricopeptide (TPR) repeat protein